MNNHASSSASSADTTTKKIVVVGGGTAGWISAAVIASANKNNNQQNTNIEIVLVESPQVKNLGVGEGTWPTMRDTLRQIGISETQFLSCCDASFKQASKFVGWRTDSSHYYHPFTAPAGYGTLNMAEHWTQSEEDTDFETFVCAQGDICEQNLAPKTVNMRDYAFNLNYGYHLNAGKFVDLLHQHCVDKLGVKYVSAHISNVVNDKSGYIKAIELDGSPAIKGDLFIDCSGFKSILIGEHYGIGFKPVSDILFNDTALAVQVEHADTQSPIASSTIASAQSNGWIWDIALQNRRGIGHVYSSIFGKTQEAEDRLLSYIENDPHLAKSKIDYKKIKFTPGHRETFWYKNCVAIGVSAGFVEPLEATALVLIEKSAEWIAAQLPRDRESMRILAKRFNVMTHSRWAEIIDFLKLHYVLSDREDSEYWIAHKKEYSIPESLQDSLVLWRSQSPWLYESNQKFELFSSASKQYVLYGMRFLSKQKLNQIANKESQALLNRFRNETYLTRKNLLKTLPKNRDFFKDKVLNTIL
jgi:2-polyprenyl-6-methoxyphenol hydroxylase-like FAD-dependent oxidoreductase